jgi:hypothetical protein
MAADNVHALPGSASIRAADVRMLIRRLSRMVYSLLYLAAGLEQVFGRGAELQRDGACILIIGLITLIVIRVVAIGFWLRKSQQAPQ